ncbi:MAG: hypothetical protein RMM08_07330 [Armatimonadota bacterium]|nr:hypothetical protein [bacterium]MDW8321157.1 hypothetical protein [Armatimonadota bacterium]
MRKEIPLWLVAVAVILALGVAVALFLWADPIRRSPVVHIGPNEVFDMKTGRAVPADAIQRQPQKR